MNQAGIISPNNLTSTNNQLYNSINQKSIMNQNQWMMNRSHINWWLLPESIMMNKSIESIESW